VSGSQQQGDGLGRALEAERKARREAEARASAAEARIAAIGAEVAAVTAGQPSAGSAGGLTPEKLQRLFELEVKAAVVGKGADPADVAAFLAPHQAKMASPEGVPDPALIEAAVATLLEAKPYLAEAQAAGQPGSVGQGAAPPDAAAAAERGRQAALARYGPVAFGGGPAT
jgi:hypothetical protein